MKKNLKKIISGLCSVALLFSTMAMSVAAEGEKTYVSTSCIYDFEAFTNTTAQAIDVAAFRNTYPAKRGVVFNQMNTGKRTAIYLEADGNHYLKPNGYLALPVIDKFIEVSARVKLNTNLTQNDKNNIFSFRYYNGGTDYDVNSYESVSSPAKLVAMPRTGSDGKQYLGYYQVTPDTDTNTLKKYELDTVDKWFWVKMSFEYNGEVDQLGNKKGTYKLYVSEDGVKYDTVAVRTDLKVDAAKEINAIQIGQHSDRYVDYDNIIVSYTTSTVTDDGTYASPVSDVKARADFEGYSAGASPVFSEGDLMEFVNPIAEETVTGNKYLDKTATGGIGVTINVYKVPARYMALSFDVKKMNSTTAPSFSAMTVSDSTGTNPNYAISTQYYGGILNNNVTTDEWTNVVILIDISNKKRTVYYNGTVDTAISNRLTINGYGDVGSNGYDKISMGFNNLYVDNVEISFDNGQGFIGSYFKNASDDTDISALSTGAMIRKGSVEYNFLDLALNTPSTILALYEIVNGVPKLVKSSISDSQWLGGNGTQVFGNLDVGTLDSTKDYIVKGFVWDNVEDMHPITISKTLFE